MSRALSKPELPLRRARPNDQSIVDLKVQLEACDAASAALWQELVEIWKQLGLTLGQTEEQAEATAHGVASILRSYVETAVDVCLLKMALQHANGADLTEGVHVPKDLTELIFAAELGRALRVSDETVRSREREGRLFSILRPGRTRGREYPAFQSWEGIRGEPLERVLVALKARSGSTAYRFFTSPTDLLGGLTAVEVMLGRVVVRRDLVAEAEALLEQPAHLRMESVLAAASAEAAWEEPGV